MQKRTLLAFLLSFVVLVVWSALFPPAKPKQTAAVPLPATTQTSQVISTKVEQVTPASTALVFPAPTPKDMKEVLHYIENSKLKVEFTNIGGTIKAITIKQYSTSLPITKIISLPEADNLSFRLVPELSSLSKVTYEVNLGGQKIRKFYSLSDNDYVIQTNVQIDEMSNLNINGFTIDSSSLDNKIHNSPEKSLYEYSVALLNQITRKGSAIDFSEKESKSQDGEVSWIGYRDRYFCLVIKPSFKTKGYDYKYHQKTSLSVGLTSASDIKSLEAKIYVGPQKLDILGKYNENFEQVMVFSNHAILDIPAKFLYFIVHYIQHVVKNWGVAIIILGLGIFFGTYPLTAQSMSSMRKMQLLQPKIQELQTKYKSDPQRMNKEVMEMYKENNVNPFGGCLPMLLQMPIFFGLYQVLWRSVDFKGASFLWIRDLSEPDRLAYLPINIPFLGNEFNILPILMAIIMFFQQKFSSKNMVVTTPEQMMQQKMMAILMPVMMGFIFYHFASGLTLYFTVFYLLSTLMQWQMSKKKVAIV